MKSEDVDVCNGGGREGGGRGGEKNEVKISKGRASNGKRIGRKGRRDLCGSGHLLRWGREYGVDVVFDEMEAGTAGKLKDYRVST